MEKLYFKNGGKKGRQDRKVKADQKWRHGERRRRREMIIGRVKRRNVD